MNAQPLEILFVEDSREDVDLASTPTNSFLYVDSSKFKEINIQKQNCRGTREALQEEKF